MMQAQDVLEIIHQLEKAGVVIWLDGGWGVDALLGQQTRPHDDVDVVISFEQVPLAEEILRGVGYAVTEEKMCYSRFAVLASLRSRRGCRRSYRQPGGKHNLDFFLDRMCSFNLFYNECNSSFSNLFKWLGNTGQRWI